MQLIDVQFDRIEEQSVEAYLQRQIKNEVRTFSDVKPSLSSTSSTEGFCYHENEYVIKDSLEKVWAHYVYTNPADAWNASKMRFGMLFSKHSNQLVYPNDVVQGIEPGQVVYLNLHVLKIKNIATAFEIIRVDQNNEVIEFSYLNDNQTIGKQKLQFIETSRGFTKIVHCSYFKSKSVLRDHFLYPYFHTRLTNNYHRNMKRMYKSKNLN
jgi:hypothetical protein